MSTRQALVITGPATAEVKEVPLPKLRDDFIIVKTKAVALNPTDWKSLERGPVDSISGCDYAGVVEEVGKALTDGPKVGDRVAGFARGADPTNHDNGAFASTIIAKGGIFVKLDENVSFEEGATLGVGISTVGQGLYQSLGFPLPPATVQEPTSILIYGGSTATGTLAIQFAKLSGLEVFTTSSPHNFDLLKRLGADHVFDYKDPGVAAKIREATNDKLAYVFDTIAEHGSPEISAAAIGSGGGKYSCILPVKSLPRNDVSINFTLAYTALGEKYNNQFPRNQVDYEFAVKFWKVTEGLLNSGKIKAHPTEVREGGLKAIPQGLKDLKDGKVSGVKLVYKIE